MSRIKKLLYLIILFTYYITFLIPVFFVSLYILMRYGTLEIHKSNIKDSIVSFSYEWVDRIETFMTINFEDKLK